MCMTPNKNSAPYGFVVIPSGAIPNADMFQDFNKLSVLKLSHRKFSFSSPPFIYCHNLRFLWLDHCQDQDNNSIDGFPQEEAEDKITAEGAGTEGDFHRCFKRLWVLDVRYTRCDQILSTRMLDFMTQLRELNVMGAQDWDICQLQGRLPNIRKLRVTKSALNCSEHNLFLGMSKMELLDLSGNHSSQEGAIKLSGICISSNQLETVMIIDGWAGIQKFSFTGCAKLKNLLLSGLFEDLRILDLSGTAVKTLDLSAMTAHEMGELFLDNCEKLCAILWPPEDRRKYSFQKVHIDTTRSAASLVPWEEKSTDTRTAMRTSAPSLSVVHGGRSPSEFDWCITVRDKRLLRSLSPVILSFFMYPKLAAHVEIVSCVVAFGSGKDNEAVSRSSSIKQQNVQANVEQLEHNWIYEDVAVAFEDHLLLQASEGEGNAPTLTWVWPCPRIPYFVGLTCYMHIQDHQVRRIEPMQEGEVTIPDHIISSIARILHVHDSFSITSMPCPATSLSWDCLNWCRVERCPNLECVFTCPQSQIWPFFNSLKTFWASCLLKAHCIWNRVTPFIEPRNIYPSISPKSFNGLVSFKDLESLHLDFCPRLIYVLCMFRTSSRGPLPLPDTLHVPNIGHYGGLLNNLQTLEIVWCGALKDVFLYHEEPDANSQLFVLEFLSLKHIHLHELPMLQGICRHSMICAPRLETVKIRGCWSLRRLPAVWYGREKKVDCDCEKEWWDKLQWEGSHAMELWNVYHHRSLYEPTHPRHYKKTMLKGSVLV